MHPIAGSKQRLSCDNPSRGDHKLWPSVRETRAVGTDISQHKPADRPTTLPVQHTSWTARTIRQQNCRQAPRGLIRSHHPVRERETDYDPSAGSPTETLLRLLLPLNATVWSSSRYQGSVTRQGNSPRTSLKHSIGSSDGRCVQRAGT